MRVLIALEHPGTSHVVEEAVRSQPGMVIVGQTDNLAKTLNLARKLRPDVAIIDYRLPHTVGIDNVPLSRTGGLDAAQIISAEIPNTRVMVLNNLDSVVLPVPGWNSDSVVSFARDTIGKSALFELKDLSAEVNEGPIFASLAVIRKLESGNKSRKITDEVILFGGVGVLCGLIMMLTVILFVPGVAIAALGGILAGCGLLAKWIIRKSRGEASQ